MEGVNVLNVESSEITCGGMENKEIDEKCVVK